MKSTQALMRTALAGAGVMGVVVWLYWPSLGFGFVYDARYQILSGDFIHDPANWWAVLGWGVMGMDVLDFNRPVHLAVLMTEAMVWGREPLGYHLTSLVVHVVNSLLVWRVATGLLRMEAGWRAVREPVRRGVWLAAAGALLFALHPVQVEAVCEPTFREDLLATGFTLGALLVAMNGSGWVRGIACVLLCLLACGSKETGVVAAGALVLWRLCFVRGGRVVWWNRVLAGCVAVAVIFTALRFGLEAEDSRIFETRPERPGGSVAAALAAQVGVLAGYGRNLVDPSGLCADYAPVGNPSPEEIAGLALVVFAAGVAAATSRRAAFALGFIVLALLPVSNIFPMYHPAADRYLYMPMAGVGMALACALASSVWRRPWLPLAVTCLALVPLAMAARERMGVWRDSRTLWTDTAEKNPNSRNAWAGIAYDLQRTGAAEDSIEPAMRALSVTKGNDPEMWLALAVGFDAKGDTKKAAEALAFALEQNPDLANTSERTAIGIMEKNHARDVAKLLAKYRNANR